MMAYKLMEAASSRWYAIRGREQVPAVISGARFQDGLPVVEETQTVESAAA